MIPAELVSLFSQVPLVAVFIWYTLRRDQRENEQTNELIGVIERLCTKVMDKLDKIETNAYNAKN